VVFMAGLLWCAPQSESADTPAVTMGENCHNDRT